jgi:hypothetical protein
MSEKDKKIQYIPGTFEGIMELFVKNLKRQTLYDQFSK